MSKSLRKGRREREARKRHRRGSVCSSKAVGKAAAWETLKLGSKKISIYVKV